MDRTDPNSRPLVKTAVIPVKTGICRRDVADSRFHGNDSFEMTSMSLKKIFRWLMFVFLFLLPWQTRWIYDPAYLNGGFFEYGSGSLYATEILLWIILIIFFIDFFRRCARCHSDRPTRRGEWGAEESLLRTIRDPSTRLGMTFALWLGGVAQGALAVWQFFSQHIGANKWLGLAEHSAGDLGAFVIESGGERWLRAYGSFGSPNALGIYLAVVLVIGLLLVIPAKAGIRDFTTADSPDVRRGNDSVKKYLFTVGQLFILSGLILSFSRGAWAAAAVGVVALLVVIARPQGGRSNPIVKQLFFYLLIIIFFFIALKPLFIARLDAVGRLETRSIAERVNQLAEWKNIFLQHPFLGVGLNKYTLYSRQLNPNLPVWQYQPIHNIYLLELAELGILGMIIFSALWFFIWRFVWRKNRIYLPVLAALFTAGLFDHWLWSMFTGMVFWWVILVIGILIAPKHS